MKSYRHEIEPRRIVASRRRELALTQVELAKRLGYPNVNFVSQLESGKSKIPLDKVDEFAAALEIDRKWFAERLLEARYPTLARVLLS